MTEKKNDRLSDLSTMREILSRHGFTFSKALGQNFLINPSVCPRMAELCGVDAESGVLEIGPGMGALTKYLASGNNHITVIEKDPYYAKLLREKFDAAVARAVARLNTLCEYCLPFVKVGGVFVAYKGDCCEEIAEAENAVKILGGRIKKVDKFELYGERRSLVVIEKVAPTPPKYPRGRGLERKKPL